MKSINYVLLLLVTMLTLSCTDKKDMVAKSIKEFTKLELGTVEYIVEKAVAAEKAMTYNNKDITVGDKKILYSITASLKAGVDLESFSPTDNIQIVGKDITVSLPKAKILVVNIAPESIRYEFSKVSWYRSDFTEAEKSEVLTKGEQSIRDSIDDLGILKDAEKNAKDYFESLFAKMGFDKITINFV